MMSDFFCLFVSSKTNQDLSKKEDYILVNVAQFLSILTLINMVMEYKVFDIALVLIYICLIVQIFGFVIILWILFDILVHLP